MTIQQTKMMEEGLTLMANMHKRDEGLLTKSQRDNITNKIRLISAIRIEINELLGICISDEHVLISSVVEFLNKMGSMCYTITDITQVQYEYACFILDAWERSLQDNYSDCKVAHAQPYYGLNNQW